LMGVALSPREAEAKGLVSFSPWTKGPVIQAMEMLRRSFQFQD